MSVETIRPTAPLIGVSVPRVEDHSLLTGAARFVDDIDRPDQVFARIVRSPAAHARIAAIDPSEALGIRGVLAVFTAADLPDVRVPIRMLASAEAERVLQPPLAREEVRYVGEPVAVVVAETQYIAEDAAELVQLELEPVPVVLDPLSATEPDAPLVHADAGSNVVNTISAVHGTDYDELVASADVVVRDRLNVERHTAVPLETRGLVAEVDGNTGRLTVWGPAKVKHFNRRSLADMLNVAEEEIRFIEPDVGGGFGVRGEFYPEDFLIPWLARQIRRPVKWIEDRSEHFVATNHAREQVCEIEIAASADGLLLGFRAHSRINTGAYARTHGGILLPFIAAHHLSGPYAWRGFEIETQSVLTNKTPAGTYRGPSQYESTFFRERMVDRVAAELDLDPVELRRRNLIPAEDLPYRADMGPKTPPLIYAAGDYPLTFGRLLEVAGYADLRDQVERRRESGEAVGVGVAAYLEAGGFGPWEVSRVVPLADGRFNVIVGIASVGQGVGTALGQIAADTLGVEMDRVTISYRDTDEVREGLGAFGSRTTILGGGAIVGAVADLERAARETAARALATTADQVIVSFADGTCTSSEGEVVALDDLGCVGEHRFEKDDPGFSMGAHLAVASVDLETGGVRVEQVFICHDVGRMINPALVDGQFVGAAAQGIAGALLESLPYDELGQPLATSFMDYLMPTSVEVPPVWTEVLELAAPDSGLGAKGAGESGIVGMGGAVANAVADAIAAVGGEVRTLPIRLDRLVEDLP